MDSRNLDKAIDIYSRLISGEEIRKNHPDNGPLYDEYYGNAEVYDIVGNILKKLNLSIYEYNEGLYITPGEGNKVFGYTNEDMKRIMGLRLNKELYMCYFIMYIILLYFYKDTGSYQFREYVIPEKVIDETSRYLSGITKELSVFITEEIEQDSFKAIALLWDELPTVTSAAAEGDKTKASRASKAGYVKLTFNFLMSQKLFVENADRYYPTDRFKAISENYFEEYRGRLYQLLGGEEDAQH
jgi:hypothetical protein